MNHTVNTGRKTDLSTPFCDAFGRSFVDGERMQCQPCCDAGRKIEGIWSAGDREGFIEDGPGYDTGDGMEARHGDRRA